MYNKGYTNIDALDANPKMLEQARKKGIYKRLICDFMGPNRLDIQDGITVMLLVYVSHKYNGPSTERPPLIKNHF